MSAEQSPAQYEIRVRGILDDRWTEWFDGLKLHNDGVDTIICGAVRDQAALHGLLAKIRDLGLTLVSVSRVGTDEPGSGRES